ncbi:hypothetical protein FRC06_008746, partial [Ceratobasidium sp. 370]
MLKNERTPRIVHCSTTPTHTPSFKTKMSDSARVLVIRDYLSKLDSGEVDAALELVTDDFVYKSEHGLAVLKGAPDIGTKDGCDKQEYKLFHTTLVNPHGDFHTTIHSANEHDDTVFIT